MDIITNFFKQKEIFNSLIVISLSYVAYLIVKKIVTITIINKKIDKKDLRQRRRITLARLFNSIIKYIIVIIAVLLLLDTLGVNVQTLIAGLGVAGLIVGLAFQDIIKDFLAGIFVILDNQYWIGEIVEINKFKGEVLELGLKTTRIINKNGEIKTIYNRNITEVTNYTINDYYLYFDIGVNIDFLEDLEKSITDLNNDYNIQKRDKDIKSIFWHHGVQKQENDILTYRISIAVKPSTDYILRGRIITLLSKKMKENNIRVISIKAVNPNE